MVFRENYQQPAFSKNICSSNTSGGLIDLAAAAHPAIVKNIRSSNTSGGF